MLEPGEIADLLTSITGQFKEFNEAQVIVNLKTLKHKWQNVFNQYGHSIEGEKSYSELIGMLAECVEESKLNPQALGAYGTITTMLDRKNGVPITANLRAHKIVTEKK